VRSVAGAVAGALAVALLCMRPVPVAAAEPSWYRLADAPAPRQEVSYVAVGQAAYLAAGGDREQDRYDLATDSWRPVSSLPVAFEGVDHVGGVAVGGEIVYAGGLLRWEYPFPTVAAVAVYDVAADAFSPGTEMPAPRAAGGVASWGGRAIYAGGLGPEGSSARVDAYDPASDSWTRLQDLPRARDHFGLVVAGGALYAVGGRLTTHGPGGIGIEEIDAVDRLDLPGDPADLAAASWSSGVATLPTPRGGLGVAAVGDCVYAVGGEATSLPPPGVTGATETYDTGSGTWLELPPLATPRHGIEAAVSGNTILVAGGGVESFAESPTAVHEALDVSAQPPCTALPHPTARRAARVLRLAVRPRRVRRGAKARALLVLSAAGTALIRARRAAHGRWRPTALRFERRLHAGRNFVRLPLRAHPLPPGRYRLLAATPADRAAGRAARDGFRVAP
jgi:hypothetical protein